MPSGPESGSPVYGYDHRQYSQSLPQPVPLFSTDYAGHLRHAPKEHDTASPPTTAPHHRDCPSPHGCSNCIHTPPAKISENPLSHRSRQTNLSHSPPRKKTDNNFPSSDNHDSPPSKQPAYPESTRTTRSLPSVLSKAADGETNPLQSKAAPASPAALHRSACGSCPRSPPAVSYSTQNPNPVPFPDAHLPHEKNAISPPPLP